MNSRTRPRASGGTERISDLVWLYVKRKPFLRQALSERLINFSALSRTIATDVLENPGKATAVKMALLRLPRRMRVQEESLNERILRLLRKSSLSLRNKVAVVISRNRIDGMDSFSYAESKRAVTYLVEESQLDALKKNRNILRTDRNLNVITLHSPVDLEETPGVVAHVLGALSSEGINVLEVISCYTDTLLVFKEADTVAAFGILSKLSDS